MSAIDGFSKYFLESPKSTYSYGTNKEEKISFWSPNLCITLNERAESIPYIGISYNKYQDEKFEIPRSSKYEKVRPILPELFDDYYKFSLQSLARMNFNYDDEFYKEMISHDYLSLQSLSNDKKNPYNRLSITIDNSIKYFSVDIYRTTRNSNRRSLQKNATVISKDDFFLFVNLTLQYLSDRNSLTIFMKDYSTKFFQLFEKPEPFSGYLVNPTDTIEQIYKQIESRKIFIEKQLIENDDVAPIERAQLRGQLEGLDYSLKAIKANNPQ